MVPHLYVEFVPPIKEGYLADLLLLFFYFFCLFCNHVDQMMRIWLIFGLGHLCKAYLIGRLDPICLILKVLAAIIISKLF